MGGCTEAIGPVERSTCASTARVEALSHDTPVFRLSERSPTARVTFFESDALARPFKICSASFVEGYLNLDLGYRQENWFYGLLFLYISGAVYRLLAYFFFQR